MAVYQTVRYGNFSYSLPNLTPGASYTVRLHFAEIYWTTSGSRVFNVAINGASVLTNFDIVTAAGAANKAVIEEFTAVADSTGTISLTFTTVVDNAMVNGIELLSSGGGASGIPAPPTNLTAVGGTGQITLTWTDSMGASGYNVKRSLTHNGPYTTIASSVSATHYLDTSVVNGTTYYYVVTAVNYLGESANSNEASATPNGTGSVAGLVFHPNPVIGGNPSIGTLTIASPAPTGGLSVTLQDSGTSGLTVPSSVVVPGGSTSVDFVAETYPVATTTTDTITATFGSTSSSAPLTVQAPSLLAVTLNPNPVIGGNATSGTATLNGEAPVGGATVTLSSSNSSLAIPDASVVVPAGATQATFAVATTAVSASTLVNISGIYHTTVAGSLILNPTNITVYLSDLSVGPTGIVDIGNVTGTVTLNAPAPAGGALVTLKSNNANVTVPASVTVAAGSQTATFSVMNYGVGDVTYVTISGKYNTWTQAAILTAMPDGYSLTIQDLGAFPGNGCAVLQWQELPSGSVTGYNVYKMVGTTPVLLNTNGPLNSPIYADTGLTNGQVYQYLVTVVDLQQQEGASTGVTATPTVAAPTLGWISPPTTTQSGRVSLYGSLTGGDVPEGSLIVDGSIVSGISTTDANSFAIGPITSGLNTAALTNGPHTFQMIGTDGTIGYATPQITFSVHNGISQFSNSGVVELDSGDLDSIDAIAPAGTASWTLSITDPQGNIVRSWQASSQRVHLTWDGLDSSGTYVGDGSFTASIMAFDQQQQPIAAQQAGQTTLRATPFALALIEYSDAEPTHQQIEFDYSEEVRAMYAWEQKQNGGEVWSFFGPTSTLSGNQLRKYLQSSKVFFLVGHGKPNPNGGAMKYTEYYDLILFPRELSWWEKGNNHISIPECALGGYNFVYLQACHSAGGVPNPDKDENLEFAIGQPDVSWAKLFGIVQGIEDGSGVFWGWSSTIPTVWSYEDYIAGAPIVPAPILKNQWYGWSIHFWKEITGIESSSENFILNAKDIATTKTIRDPSSMWYYDAPGGMHPWDYQNYGSMFSRGVFFGDPFGMLHSP